MTTARSYSFYWALIGLAVAVNAAGYLLNLWHEETIFDEVVHAFTSFAVVATVGRLWIGERDRVPGPVFLIGLVALGMCIGVAWEGFEWLIGIIGGQRDTVMDLVMDGLGSIAAALLLKLVFSPPSHLGAKDAGTRPITKRE